VFASYTGDDPKAARAPQRKFSETTSMNSFADCRARFDRAGINIRACNPLIPVDMSDRFHLIHQILTR
jgi:hypothetical protein